MPAAACLASLASPSFPAPNVWPWTALRTPQAAGFEVPQEHTFVPGRTGPTTHPCHPNPQSQSHSDPQRIVIYRKPEQISRPLRAGDGAPKFGLGVMRRYYGLTWAMRKPLKLNKTKYLAALAVTASAIFLAGCGGSSIQHCGHGITANGTSCKQATAMIHGLQINFAAPLGSNPASIVAEAGSAPEVCVNTDGVPGTDWETHGKWKCTLNHSTATATVAAAF